MGAERVGDVTKGLSGVRGSRWAPAGRLAGVVAIVAALVGCTGDGRTPTGTLGSTSGIPSVTSSAPTADALPAAPAPTSSAPTPRGPVDAEVSIPSIGVEDLDIVAYEGTTDDPAGTRIQDRGVAASPHGERGGVGPGEVGNYLVTAHRLSAGGPLRELPSVEVGDRVHVTAEGTVYTYEIVETRTTSFRSARSLAEQRAAVPGEPGEKPTRAMITLSTCATPEDDAAGNFWRDAQGNPEHRIDKIGVLTSTRPV
ncbi:class E sortase [Streptomyces sp. NPDC016459]|uniref:class E sortase n=1 Tax=Streptomyces sp. NPDC016459 TaxID=3157190 RepID=UPI0033FFAF60